jgi:peptidoglycan hydrolase CwlO-like protein
MSDIWPSDFEDNMEKAMSDTREHSLDVIVLQDRIQEQKAEIARLKLEVKILEDKVEELEEVIWQERP